MNNAQGRKQQSPSSTDDALHRDSLGGQRRRRSERYAPPPVSPQRERAHLIWDFFIIALVAINLALIVFDALYALTPLPRLMEAISPAMNAAYNDYVHANFFTIDLCFVAIFALDVLVSWAVAIAEKRYHRWFFYPFVHWYDVLGCIPLAGFRILRVLRVIGLIVRLQRSGLIDIRQWAIYDFCDKYYQILLEELSDRVMVKALTTAQEEIGDNGQLTARITQDVFLPRKERLIEDISQRLQGMIDHSYYHNRQQINDYLGDLVHNAIHENPEIRRIKRMPFGDSIVQTMDSALNDVIRRTLHEVVEGMHTPGFKQMTSSLADSGFDALLSNNAHANAEIERALVDTLEAIKAQVQVRRWRERYDE
ncbi:ion transporter [Phytohalomonas tamaricis]|uniref:ion transporter n=1 Tax=Phytohalomonas tamaricis TaxID=2081032 RepID=UPI0021D4501B|nr:ion transporter [Phytohalomonas tamaricis]